MVVTRPETGILSRPGTENRRAVGDQSTDPNAGTDWTFSEFTYDLTSLFVNVSFVDFVALPVALSLDTPQGTQIVRGLPPGGLDKVCEELRNLGGDWPGLIVTAQDGTPRRVLSPNQALSVNKAMFAGYLDGYIDQVWQKYTGTDLTIDTQSGWGTTTGRVTNGVLSFPGVGSFTKPTTPAVFSCSLPPFTTTNDEMGNLSARLAAALNRTTLLANPHQPTDENPDTYYQQPDTNHYARILHQTTSGTRSPTTTCIPPVGPTSRARWSPTTPAR